jgi:aspartate carbamoyltransferase regulatory subunit
MNRTPKIQKIIDDRLSNFLSPDVIKELNSDEIEVANDALSNLQLRQLAGAAPSVIKNMVRQWIVSVERRKLTQIQPDELEGLMAWYEENCSEIEEVVDPATNEVIALELKHNTLDSRVYFRKPNYHWDGRFIVTIGDRLLGFRSRIDDVMGYQSGSKMPNPEKAQIMKDHKAEVAAAKKAKEPVPTEPEVPDMVRSETDSRASQPELDIIPEDHLWSSLTTNDIIKVKAHMNETNYEKPVKKIKDGYQVDGFILRKVK